jgi:hypothetical protein
VDYSAEKHVADLSLGRGYSSRNARPHAAAYHPHSDVLGDTYAAPPPGSAGAGYYSFHGGPAAAYAGRPSGSAFDAAAPVRPRYAYPPASEYPSAERHGGPHGEQHLAPPPPPPRPAAGAAPERQQRGFAVAPRSALLGPPKLRRSGAGGAALSPELAGLPPPPPPPRAEHRPSAGGAPPAARPALLAHRVSQDAHDSKPDAKDQVGPAAAGRPGCLPARRPPARPCMGAVAAPRSSPRAAPR